MACLAVFLHEPSGPSAICTFPPHSWSAPDGLPLLLRKQPIWAAGNTPNGCQLSRGYPSTRERRVATPPPLSNPKCNPFLCLPMGGMGGGGGVSTPSLILTKYL